jgi:hypothetical protein
MNKNGFNGILYNKIRPCHDSKRKYINHVKSESLKITLNLQCQMTQSLELPQKDVKSVWLFKEGERRQKSSNVILKGFAGGCGLCLLADAGRLPPSSDDRLSSG